jgi:hypothetical protein
MKGLIKIMADYTGTPGVQAFKAMILVLKK